MSRARLGVVGTGFIATHLMKAIDRRDDLEVTRVLTRRSLPGITGIPEDLLTNSIDDLVRSADVIVECSGDPIWATDVVASAVSAGIPVVTMNTEFHITVGSAFVGEGMVTEAEGDQPGCLAALHEEATEMGFTPVAYGNMKGFLNPDPTPEEMQYWGARQGISLEMVTSFTDGTKVQAEQILVGNHFGATISVEGMLGPAVEDLAQGAEILGGQAESKGRPITDFVVNRDLPHGVFLIATQAENQRDALEYLKLGPGPRYTLVKNNILVHLEIPKTLRRVLDGGSVLLDNSARPELSLAAVAKRDLVPGTRITRAIGSFDLRGRAVRFEDRPDHVPIGLLQEAIVTAPIERGELVDWTHVEIPETTAKQLFGQRILGALASG